MKKNHGLYQRGVYSEAIRLFAWMFLTFIPGAIFGSENIRALEPTTEPIHVRVLFEAHPSKEAVIAWTTTAEGSDHRLYYDTMPRSSELSRGVPVQSAYKYSLPSTHSAPYTLRPEEAEAGMHAWSHNVYLSDLKPGTAYYLTVLSDGDTSEEFHFVTAPDTNSPVRVLAVGDSRTPRVENLDGTRRTHPENTRRQVNATMRRQLEAHPRIIALLHGADYTKRAYWGELYWWLKDHTEMTTTAANRLLPIIPARGNHDLDIGFEEMFWWPDRENDFYYASHLNAETALITLNTEISRGGNQREWLESQLEELRSEKRWLMAMYHRPAYPSVRDYKSAAPQRSAWVPLFEQYGLDLSYESHDHALKRTHPIFAGEINRERGIIYFGDGGGGVAQRHPHPDRWYLAKTGRYHHIHMLSFGNNKLDVEGISIDDEVIDAFSVSHDRRRSTERDAVLSGTR